LTRAAVGKLLDENLLIVRQGIADILPAQTKLLSLLGDGLKSHDRR
jgi:hypothetical protein